MRTDLGPSWISVTLGVLLLLVFIPVGLCGLVLSFSLNTATDPVANSLAPFAYVSLAVGALFVYVAYLVLKRK